MMWAPLLLFLLLACFIHMAYSEDDGFDEEEYDVGDMEEDMLEGSELHSSNVLNLDPDTYKTLVYDDKTSLFVKFYVPWCGHCQQLAPTWSTLAEAAVSTDLKVAAIDCEDHGDFCTEFGIEGFPTLKFIDAPRRRTIDYSGERSIDAMYDFLLKDARTQSGSVFPEDQGPLDRAMAQVTHLYDGIVSPVMQFSPFLLPGTFLLGFLVAMSFTCCWCLIGSPRVIIEFQSAPASTKDKRE